MKYHRHPFLLLWTATAFFSVCSAASLSVPLFPFHALEVSAVTDALRENGLLAIEMPPEYEATRNLALNGVCSCWNSLSEARSVLGSTSVNGLLQQGARTTVATATAGSTTPLPLPAEIAQICGTDVAEALDSLRDQVAMASQAFISAWDRSMSSRTRIPLLRTQHGVEYHRIQDIVEASTHLEHFHLYSKTTDETSNNDHDLAVHTDAGLFLSFVPALDCHNNGKGDSAFWVEDRQGKLQSVEFPENAVIIMMGAGAEHWLHSEEQVRATRHAVRMQEGTMRAWYGMMHLVPSTAIVQEHPEPRTLADLQQALMHTRSDATLQERFPNEEDVVSMGCGSVASIPEERNETPFSPRRRRLAMVDNASVCNNVTNFYCWMSCLDIPDTDHAQESGYGLYCVDPSVLDSTGNNVSQAVEPCVGENGLAGSAMKPICTGSWQPLVDGVPVSLQVLATTTTTTTTERPYCYGGSTMFHEGFQWKGATCAIYLFPSWVLSTQAKFVAACFGSILLGLLVEIILWQRRNVMKRTQASSRAMRLTMSALIYGLQLTGGYLVMLVVMIYSAPLFVAVVGGLVLGHVLFNAKDAVFAKEESAIRKRTSISSSEEEDGTDKASQSRNSGSDDHHVEGMTPCCQYTM